MFFAQAAQETTFWSKPNDSILLWVIGAVLLGVGMIFALMQAPTRARTPIVAIFMFLSGLFWVLTYIWPRAPFKADGQIPDNFTESVSFWLQDANPVVSTFANTLQAFILGLGIFSLGRLHVKRLVRKQTDWVFSAALLGAMISMLFFGYMSFYAEIAERSGNALANADIFTTGKDLLFDGMLQELEAGMFSVIAFFILSAAYRAFRIRSVESTILLGAALLVVISLMGAIVVGIDNQIDSATKESAGHFLNNFKLSEVSAWIQTTIQAPAIRAMDIGVGIGTVAMGLRLWLSLEKTGGQS